MKEELRELMEILADAFDNVDDDLFWDAYDRLCERLSLGKKELKVIPFYGLNVKPTCDKCPVFNDEHDCCNLGKHIVPGENCPFDNANWRDEWWDKTLD